MVLARFCQGWRLAYCVPVYNHGNSNHWIASTELYVPVCFVIQ